MMNIYETLAQNINKANHIVVLSGAGLSTNSGIPDFRSSTGVYNRELELPVEQILSVEYFNSNPEKFWFYFKYIFNFKLQGTYRPNYGHDFLSMLEKTGKRVSILTQNVDNLHKEAGSKEIYELHGNIKVARCPRCKEKYTFKQIMKDNVPRCSLDGAILKSDVVLFGESVRNIDIAYELAHEADMFFVLGSSLQVHPANQIPRLFQNATEIQKVIINKEVTQLDSMFNYVLHEDIVQVFKKISMRLGF